MVSIIHCSSEEFNHNGGQYNEDGKLFMHAFAFAISTGTMDCTCASGDC